jgi:hypothetical protein
LKRPNGLLSDFSEEAMRVVNEGERAGLLLRLMGATAIMHHCPKHRHLFGDLGRNLTDLDFMTYGKFRGKLEKFFVQLGYRSDKRTSYYFGESRHRYFDDVNSRVVDVFFDKLAFCHTIEFAGRLELDSPTITLSDLLLEKMQIVEINEKDIKDTVILLREHSVQNDDKECVDPTYVARLLGNDWGFCFTVTANLGKVKDFLDHLTILTPEDKQDVRSKVGALLKAIEVEPKTMKWKMRAKVGTRKRWYTKVETFKH